MSPLNLVRKLLATVIFSAMIILVEIFFKIRENPPPDDKKITQTKGKGNKPPTL
jgi:hypothetical protein